MISSWRLIWIPRIWIENLIKIWFQYKLIWLKSSRRLNLVSLLLRVTHKSIYFRLTVDQLYNGSTTVHFSRKFKKHMRHLFHKNVTHLGAVDSRSRLVEASRIQQSRQKFKSLIWFGFRLSGIKIIMELRTFESMDLLLLL